MSNESNTCRHCYWQCQISKGCVFGTHTVIKRHSGSNYTWDVSFEIPRSGAFTHLFKANRAVAINVLRKHIMEVHIENDSERRTKMPMRYFTVLAENDKPGYSKQISDTRTEDKI